MDSFFGGPNVGILPTPYTQDSLLADLSNQMATSRASRRHSRGSTGQRASSAMRVVKPSSTSNSPRSSALISRRRTLVNGSQTPIRHPQTAEYLSAVPNHDIAPSISRPARPVSWHPSSEIQHYAPPPQPHANYPFSTPNMYAEQSAQLSQPLVSPMMTYSNNTSPASSFSPLPTTANGVDSVHLTPGNAWDASSRTSQIYQHYDGTGRYAEAFPTLGGLPNGDAGEATGLDWNAFVMHGYNNTTPPTPETYPQVCEAKPVVPAEESIPYQSLEESEEEGEILVGMGLYDTPEKKEEDPQLNNYRSTVTSLLGSKFRSEEPTGRGLKLEETWEPPKSEDGDEDNDDDDEEDDED